MAESAEVASSLKRPFPEDELIDTEMPNTPAKAMSTAGSSPLSSPVDQSSRDVSMPAFTAPVDQSSSILANPTSSAMPTTTQKAAPPPKRRKLTPQERAQEQAERAAKKEAKEKEKTEAAAKKEEEKQKKAAEQEQKRKAREAENKIKEEEKSKKAAEAEAKKKARDEEKLRKERSQMRLSAFFNTPQATSLASLSDSKTLKASPCPSPAKFITKDEARRKSLSLEPGEPVESLFADIPKLNLMSNSSEQIKNQRFLPFNVPKQAKMAPHNRFLPELEQELARVNKHLDSYFTATPGTATSNLRPEFLEVLSQHKVNRGYVPLLVQAIVERIHGSSRHPIDLISVSEEQPSDLLQTCTMKYIHFGQDVRPPYCGTWTKPQSLEKARALARNPFKQLLPQLDYDYDSEAEWEEPEDGEDVDSDGEEDEEDGEEDLDGFLDDENPPDYLQARKGQMSNDLVPVCSGLQWEDASGVLHAADGGQAADFSCLKMGALLDPRPPTIDPLTRSYWEEEFTSVSSMALRDKTIVPGMGLMNPPRVPLQDRPSGFLNGTNGQVAVNGKALKAVRLTKLGRVVSAELLPAFKHEVQGSDMTKLAIVEHLKVKFPKMKKDDINATLVAIAHRVGPKASEKKWVLFDDET